MIHTKSNMAGMVLNYQQMYDIIKNWDECETKGCYLYDMGWIIEDMGYFGWTNDAAKNEIHHYKEVNKAYNALKFALENALGIEQEE